MEANEIRPFLVASYLRGDENELVVTLSGLGGTVEMAPSEAMRLADSLQQAARDGYHVPEAPTGAEPAENQDGHEAARSEIVAAAIKWWSAPQNPALAVELARAVDWSMGGTPWALARGGSQRDPRAEWADFKRTSCPRCGQPSIAESGLCLDCYRADPTCRPLLARPRLRPPADSSEGASRPVT